MMNERWLRFNSFQINPETGDLLGADGPVGLQPLPSRVLTLLVLKAGALVTRDDIKRRIWGETTFAADQALNAAIRQIRIALDDSATEPRFVSTVPRKGYRFVAQIEPGSGPSPFLSADAATENASQHSGAPVTAVDQTEVVGGPRVTLPRAWRNRSPSSRLLIVALAVITIATLVGIDRLAGFRGVSDSVGSIREAANLPEDARLEYLKGRELLKRSDPGSWRDAATAFEAVRAQSPDFLPATAGAGHAALRLGQFERAAGLAAWTLASDSLNGEAHMILGATLLQRGNWDQARTAFERARSLAPDLVGSYTGLAVLAALDERPEAAFELAEAALDADPLSAITLGDAGYVALWTGHPQRAIDWCRHAQDLQPDWSIPKYCLLDAYHDLGRAEAEQRQAAAILRLLDAPSAVIRDVEAASAPDGLRRYRSWQIERLDPAGSEPPELAGYLAVLRMQEGNVDDAVRLLEVAAETDPVGLRFTLLDPVFDSLQRDPRFGGLAPPARSGL